MRKLIFTLLCVVILASVSAVSLIGCGDDVDIVIPEAAGDYMEAGYSFDGGTVGIPAGGTVSVTHGLIGTPTGISVMTALALSGSATDISVSSVTDTSFLITLATIGANGALTASSGSVTWTATTE